MQNADQLLIIGLDGTTWDVLDPWIKEGVLPNLARLRQNGSWGNLNSSIPPITAAAWSSFMTGKRPGKHGVYHFIKLFDEDNATTNKPELVNARSLKSPTMWDILGHHNKKLGLINIPMTYPPRPVNGFMITGLLTPKNASVFTHPPELSNNIKDYIIDLDRFIDKKPYQTSYDSDLIAPTLSLMQEFTDMLEKRTSTTLSLMNSQLWDVFMVVFTGPDRMGHYLWPYHRSPTADDLPEIQQLCQAVQAYYIRLDEIVGELIDNAGPEPTVLIISDHGMGPPPAKRVHGNNWLRQHGWLTAATTNPSITNPDSLLKRLGLPRDKIGRLVRLIPGFAKTSLVQKAVSTRSDTVDKEKSNAYCIPIFDNILGIRLNNMLKGEQREALRLEIMQGLQTITDPDTGEAVVKQVLKGEDYYQGPYAVNIPDIIVILYADYGAGFHLSHYSSIVTRRPFVSEQAIHRIEGIFLAAGPNITANPEPLENLRLEDIIPTALHLMNLPVPSDMDGRVLAESIKPEYMAQHPVKYGDPTERWPDDGNATFSDEVMSEEDEELIRDRLEALGYLE